MPSIPPHTPRRLTIIGGGFSGCTAAAQLIRTCPVPLAIAIVEPRTVLGQGLAYATDDDDHRLNGTLDVHMLDPADPDELRRWCDDQRILDRDPEALVADGSLFIRRSDFCRYLGDALRRRTNNLPPGWSMRHVRDRAVDVALGTHGFDIHLKSAAPIASDLVIIATGNAVARLPAFMGDAFADHPQVIASLDDVDRMRAIAHDARVLVMGSSLTALDAISSLLRRGHGGQIVVVSRHGLRPRPYRPKPAVHDATTRPPLDRIDAAMAPFIANVHPLTLRRLVRALRARIAACERAGQSWYVAFDELRDVLWQFWPHMPVDDKRRFLRLLRTWYDVHRFRAPPQNDAMVRDAERRGAVLFKAARICSASSMRDSRAIRVVMRERGCDVERIEAFDALINCTGLDAAGGPPENPLLVAMLQRGLLSVDNSGVGFAVDGQCRAIGSDGTARDHLRIIGPPTAGVFGDPLGALFIAAQVRRILPSLVAALSRA